MRNILLCICCLVSVLVTAQKKKEPEFCGMRFTKIVKMTEQLQDQFEFLQLQEGDTIVDIGAASGWFEGAFAATSQLKNLNFILVDIDTGCLSRAKVDNMVRHYSGLKESPITHRFHIVHNTADSLFLPRDTYNKVWLFNMLHEVPDKESMLQSARNILRDGGEIVLLEFIPRKPGAVHGGCKKPLLPLEEWKTIFSRQGFRFAGSALVGKRKNTYYINMARFIKS